MLLTAGSYATFLGGSASEAVHDIAVDPAGYVYVVGSTRSFDFPSVPGVTAFSGPEEAFVVKLDPAGSIFYATFLGGSGEDWTYGVAVNAAGQAHITGGTYSSDFPVFHAHQPTLGGRCNVFVTVLNEFGTDLVYSTYLGGQGLDTGRSIAVDPMGFAYVTGVARSPNFPTTPGVLGPGPVSGEDCFVAKFTPEGYLKYSTLLGGVDCWGLAIALGGAGYEHGQADAFVTGKDSNTISGVPVASPFSSGGYEAFVVRLNSSGRALHYLAYVGGNSADEGWDIAVDRADNAYITGTTLSTDFFTTDGATFRPGFSSGTGLDICHAFVVKLNPNGTLNYSILLQGDQEDAGHGIAVDGNGFAYVIGSTCSSDFPITPDALSSWFSLCSVFLAILDYRGRLKYCTFFGGGWGKAIAVDELVNVFLAGESSPLGFPVGAPAFGGGSIDTFVTRVRWI